MIAQADAIYFSVDNALWRTDGTDRGTRQIHDNVDPYLAEVNGDILFVSQHALWKYDPDTDLVQRVAEAGNATLRLSAVAGETIYFVAGGRYGGRQGGDDGRGLELWKSDLTASGTKGVKDIWPGATGSDIHSLVAVGNRVFFTARDGVHQRELWVSDGSESGTYLVKDVYVSDVPQANAYLRNLQESNGLLYFSAFGGPEQGMRIWRSDGTFEGTIPLMAARMRVEQRVFFTSYRGETYFLNGYNPNILWKSDGTARGTVPVDIGVDNLLALGLLNGRLMLNQEAATWISDGTREGTVKLADVSISLYAFPGRTMDVPGNFLVFPHNTPDTGRELFRLSAPLGDTNFDLQVDLEDLNNVRDHFGGYGLGDADHDGDVDLEDLNAVRNRLSSDIRGVDHAQSNRRLDAAHDAVFASLANQHKDLTLPGQRKGRFHRTVLVRHEAVEPIAGPGSAQVGRSE
jgi:ELWxxDGT repeat protein